MGEERFNHRAAFFDSASRQTELVSVDTADGHTFLVATDDPSVGRVLFLKRTRGEIRQLPRIAEHLRRRGNLNRDATIVDVGANIGTSTITALTTCGFHRAVAVEPDPDNLRILRANLALNGLDGRCSIVEAAATDHTGHAQLVQARKRGAHSVAATGGYRCAAVTLDSLHLDNVGLLWIDVQGHEGHVLAGAADLLKARPPVVVEVTPERLRKHGTAAAFMDALSRYGAFAFAKAPHLESPLSALPDVLDRPGTFNLVFLP